MSRNFEIGAAEIGDNSGIRNSEARIPGSVKFFTAGTLFALSLYAGARLLWLVFEYSGPNAMDIENN